MCWLNPCESSVKASGSRSKSPTFGRIRAKTGGAKLVGTKSFDACWIQTNIGPHRVNFPPTRPTRATSGPKLVAVRPNSPKCGRICANFGHPGQLLLNAGQTRSKWLKVSKPGRFGHPGHKTKIDLRCQCSNAYLEHVDCWSRPSRNSFRNGRSGLESGRSLVPPCIVVARMPLLRVSSKLVALKEGTGWPQEWTAGVDHPSDTHPMRKPTDSDPQADTSRARSRDRCGCQLDWAPTIVGGPNNTRKLPDNAQTH